MSRLLLQISCAPGDADAITDALRGLSAEPVHVVAERVHGRDFSDARSGEQVSGMLDRRLVSLAVDADAVERMIEAAGAAGRRQPMRWRVLPLMAEGRVA